MKQVDDIYMDLITEYGKVVIWSKNLDELCDLIDEKYIIYRKEGGR